MRTKWFALLTILQFLYWRAWVLADEVNPVNDSPESNRLGDIYHANMQPDINPCVDFFDYVCHNWEQNNPRPRFQAMWNIDTVMEHRAYKELKEYIEKLTDISSESISKAKTLYNVCVNGPSMKRLVVERLKNILISHDHKWAMLEPENNQPSIDLPWKVDKMYIELTGESALFDYLITYEDEQGFISGLNSMISPYGMVGRRISWNNTIKELQEYMNFLKTMIEKVAPNPHHLSSKLIETDLKQVITFRETLRNIIRTIAPHMLRSSFSEFQTIYDQQRKLRGLEEVDWLQQIRAMHKTSKSSKFPEITPSSYILWDKNYFNKLIDLLANTERRVIVNHIHMYFVERHLQLDAEMIKQLEESITDRVVTTGIIRIDKPKWIKCLEESNMQDELGKMYLKASFSKSTYSLVLQLLRVSKDLLIKEIVNSKWVDSRTKKNSVAKLNSLRNMMGLPNWYISNSAPPVYHAFCISPLKVKAQYDPKLNLISFTAANLQWPIYSPNLPYVIDYGATVSALAHELYHAFDEIGITETMLGRYDRWSSNMREEYSKRAKCISNQYEEYRRQQFIKYNITQHHFSKSTLNEDLPDVMGLQLAYKGYKNQLKKNKGVCPILPKFQNFSCDQLFFIAFANTFCHAVTTGAIEKYLMEDTHSLFNLRVNGAVANMKEFSDAFSCKPRDPLNLKKRCRFWK